MLIFLSNLQSEFNDQLKAGVKNHLCIQKAESWNS